MASDAATFFWGFAAIFGGLGWYLWHLERKVDDMRRRLDAVTPRGRPVGASDGAGEGRDARDKNEQTEERP